MPMICEPGQHHWIPHDAGYGWVVCEKCATLGVCKGCREGDATLPDIFCLAHQGMPPTVFLTHRLLAARLVVLAGTIPGALWHADAQGEWAVVGVSEGIEVSCWHAATYNAWKVQVYLVDRVAPVFLADGAYPALTVRSARPGMWMMTIRDAISWRDALPVETESGCDVG
jgi:hypothetical protein